MSAVEKSVISLSELTKRSSIARWKFLLYLFLMLAAVDAMLRANMDAIRAYDLAFIPPAYSKDSLYSANAVPDLVFLGNSRIDQGIKTRVFRGVAIDGVKVGTVFNYGEGGDLLMMTERARHIVKRDKMPKMVIFGVDPFLFNVNSHEAHRRFLEFDVYRQLANKGGFARTALAWARDNAVFIFSRVTHKKIGVWKGLIWRVDQMIERHWRLYKYKFAVERLIYERIVAAVPGMENHRPRLGKDEILKGLVKQLEEGRKEGPVDADGLVMKRGGLTVTQRIAMNDPTLTFTHLDNWRMGEMEIRQFEILIDLFRGKGIPVIFLQMPVTERISRDMYIPGLWEDYISYLGAYAKRRGIPIMLPENSNCGLDNDDFYDLHHLTEAGQLKFSECLRPMLEDVAFP
jgi:hypothetical protein